LINTTKSDRLKELRKSKINYHNVAQTAFHENPAENAGVNPSLKNTTKKRNIIIPLKKPADAVAARLCSWAQRRASNIELIPLKI